VVTRDVAEDAVVAGVPARVIRMRERPVTLRWG
jgi:acetyltransferase-like isoleucine patch superfamily enzyme